MDTLSISKTGRLFWLGRYVERVYTTLQLALEIYDMALDGGSASHSEYCAKLGIPDVYESGQDFCRKYTFDSANPISILSSLGYAYDNAIVMRETIGSMTLSYIQLAMTSMERAEKSSAPALELQEVLDDIMAFRGSCEENIDDEMVRNIIKCGAGMERADLYLRLGYPKETCRRELSKLLNRLYKTQMQTNVAALNQLVGQVMDRSAPAVPDSELLRTLESLFPDV